MKKLKSFLCWLLGHDAYWDYYFEDRGWIRYAIYCKRCEKKLVETKPVDSIPNETEFADFLSDCAEQFSKSFLRRRYRKEV